MRCVNLQGTMLLFGYETNIIIILLKGLYLIFLLKASMTLYFVQCVKKGEDSMANPGAKSNGT